MNHSKFVRNVLLAALMAVALLASLTGAQARQIDRQPAAPESPVGTAFTYQGQLKDGSSPANGTYDFEFVLYDAAVGGAQVPGTPIVTKDDVAVSGGQFTVLLDFGDVFGADQRFLEIGVRPGTSTDLYIFLSPRQELTPVPFARSVPWSGVTGKPQSLTLRKIYVPGAAFGHTVSANFESDTWGLTVKSNSLPAGFVVPRPADWDVTTPFTVTLYFALPTVPADSVVNWRLWAGGAELNLPQGSASTGWDSLNYGPSVNGTPLDVYAPSGGYFDLMKSQSWSPKWSTTFNTWYFGSNPTTADDFVGNPIWHFSFIRGVAVGNGETFTGDMVITGADISYRAVP